MYQIAHDTDGTYLQVNVKVLKTQLRTAIPETQLGAPVPATQPVGVNTIWEK